MVRLLSSVFHYMAESISLTLSLRVEAIYDSACNSSFDHLNDVVIFGSIWIPCSWKIIDTIEPRFADTRLLHPPDTETSFLRTVLFSPGKSLYIFSKFNPLNTDTR